MGKEGGRQPPRHRREMAMKRYDCPAAPQDLELIF